MDATQSWIGNVEILQALNAQLHKESWYNTFWNQFSGDVEVFTDENGNPKYSPSGMPIEMMTEPQSQGRDNLLIPFLNRLTGAPVYGDTTLKGTGEEMSLRWLRSYVNQTRKAVMQRTGQMSELRAELHKLYQEAQPLLTDWWTQYQNQEVARAFYEGVSYNLSNSTANEGLGLYKRYHPNFYRWDDTNGLSAVAGTEGETPTAAEIDTAVGNLASADSMQAALLRALATKLMNLRIPRMQTASGFKYWPILMHPASYESLYGDSEFTNANREAFSTAQLNAPELHLAESYYYGFVIYTDIVAVRGWDNAAGGFFGDDESSRIQKLFEPTDITDNYCSVVFGPSAMGRAVGQRLHFTKEIDDHENTIEIGGAIIDGFNRADFTVEDTAGETSGDLFRKNTTGGVASGIETLNQSSCIVMTVD